MPLFLMTGSPGTGKTTAIMRLSEMLREKGKTVGGVVSREVRKNNVRIGFEFVDIRSNETVMLASVGGRGPRVSKYAVNMDGCAFAVRTLRKAFVDTDIVICDELGPMEFKSSEFVDCVKDMVNLDKPIVAVVHKRLRHSVIDSCREKVILLINLDIQNRNKVPDLLLDRLA